MEKHPKTPIPNSNHHTQASAGGAGIVAAHASQEHADVLIPLPQDLVTPQLTIRAIVTGMILGSILSLCNIYAGLKVGWSFNISIIAVLMSYGFWQGVSRRFGSARWTMLENNTSQTTASSAASISSAGLVTAIPALTMLTGRQLTWGELAIWTLSVCLVGIFVGASLRRQMILRDPLPFPAGVATALTLKDIYARDDGAKTRIRALLGSGALAGGWLLVHNLLLPFDKIYFSFVLPFLGKLKESGVSVLTTANLGWGLDPSLLLMGTGALIGFRVAASLYQGRQRRTLWLPMSPRGRLPSLQISCMI